MKSLKLIAGQGSYEAGAACWMSALTYYTEQGTWHDHPDCVCSYIQNLCILLNDSLPDDTRAEVIGPHLFEPVGTALGLEMKIKRQARAYEKFIQDFMIPFFKSINFDEGVKVFKTVETDRKIRIQQWSYVKELFKACQRDKAQSYQNLPVYVIERNEKKVEIYDWLDSLYHKLSRSTDIAYNMIYVSLMTRHNQRIPVNILDFMLELILELCKMGREEIKPVRTKEKVLDLISCL